MIRQPGGTLKGRASDFDLAVSIDVAMETNVVPLLVTWTHHNFAFPPFK